MPQPGKAAELRAGARHNPTSGVVRVIQERNRAVREEARATLRARTRQWKQKRAEIQSKIDAVRHKHQAYVQQMTRATLAKQQKNVEDVRKRLEVHRQASKPKSKAIETVVPAPKPVTRTPADARKKGGARR